MAPSTVPISDLELAAVTAAFTAVVLLVTVPALLLVGALLDLAIHLATVVMLRLRHRKRPR